MEQLTGRQRQAIAIRKLWDDPEYKANAARKISEEWKRRREAKEAAKVPEEIYHVPDLPGEVWKDIEGYEGLYAVSNKGRVKSLYRVMPHKTHGTWRVKERILKQSYSGYKQDHSDGYLFVFLHKGKGEQHIARVHRLVAEHFIPRIPGKDVVNHIDCDKSNNNVENLEWCTFAENSQHAVKNNRINYHDRKRPVENVETGERFDSARDAERHYRVARSAIEHAIRKGGMSCGFHWRYAEKKG